MEKTKKCSVCRDTKDWNEFAFKNKRLGIKVAHCKQCQHVKSKLHYHNNKQDYLDRNNDRKADLRNYLQNLKKTLTCSNCPENHPACLEFHHRDPSTKLGQVSAYNLFGSIKKLQEEIDKCDILCANCHRKLHCKID